MQRKFPNKNANVIESRNQASVGLTLLKSKVSCLSSPRLFCYADARFSVLFSRETRLGRTRTLHYRPIRMPDSFTFGCPAPRLGLDLASLSSVLARDAGFAQLRLCSLSELLSFWPKIEACAGKHRVWNPVFPICSYRTDSSKYPVP